MPKKKGQAKVPFADMLAAIDRCDFDFYSRLTEEQKKARQLKYDREQKLKRIQGE